MERKKLYTVFLGKLKRREFLEDLHLDGRVIVNWALEKQRTHGSTVGVTTPLRAARYRFRSPAGKRN
jgi:hypothetical protein